MILCIPDIHNENLPTGSLDHHPLDTYSAAQLINIKQSKEPMTFPAIVVLGPKVASWVILKGQFVVIIPEQAAYLAYIALFGGSK